MDEAECDVLAFMTFPRAHWSQIYSTNPLERLNAEIKRGTNVVGIVPNPASCLRLARALFAECSSANASAARREPRANVVQTSSSCTRCPARSSR